MQPLTATEILWLGVVPAFKNKFRLFFTIFSIYLASLRGVSRHTATNLNIELECLGKGQPSSDKLFSLKQELERSSDRVIRL